MEQRRLDIASLFSPLPGMGVGMNVSDMASYSHYPPHYSYQVRWHLHLLIILSFFSVRYTIQIAVTNEFDD